VGNLLTQLARCCRPVPGDPIIGYITQGAGVSIHRQDCANALRLASQHRERMIEVEWSGASHEAFPVDIQVVAFDRQGLLRDISGVFSELKLNLVAVNTHTDRQDNTAYMTFTVEIAEMAQLGRALDRIATLPNVREARRRI